MIGPSASMKFCNLGACGPAAGAEVKAEVYSKINRPPGTNLSTGRHNRETAIAGLLRAPDCQRARELDLECTSDRKAPQTRLVHGEIKLS